MQQTDSGDLLQFHQQATTFNLNVVLVGNKLKITLQDFTQWLLYSKDYTEQDIGDEIHKKVDLTDLYFSLAYSQNQKAKNSDQKNEEQKQFMKEYSFGDVIKRGQRKCYQISKGGKITIYCIGFDHKNGEQIYHESKLQLTKIRQLNEIQIISERFLLEKRQHTKRFQRELQKIKIQNKKLTQLYTQVKKQNKKMQQKLQQTQEQNLATKQQIKTLKQQQMKTNEQLKQNKQTLKQYMKQLEKYKTSLTPISQKVNQNNTKVQAVQAAIKKYKEQGCNTLYIFTLPQTYSNKFSICSNRIQYIDNGWTQYIFNQKIPYNGDFVFKIKIIKTSSKNIMVGIVDYTKQKTAKSSYSTPNALCYYGINGYKYPIGQVQGTGYSQGQTVQINANLANKTVKWLVSGSQRATGTQDSLADQARVYYPFIQLFNKNDIVSWSFE